MDTVKKLCQVISGGQFAILDNNKDENKKSSYVFSQLRTFYTASSPGEVQTQLDEIEKQIESGRYAVGYFSYELGYVLNQRINEHLPENRNVPLFCVGIYDDRMEVDSGSLDAAFAQAAGQDDVCITNCRLNMSKEDYLDRIGSVKRHIYNGDTYQVNYTLKYKFNYAGSTKKLYAELRKRQRVEYGAYLDFPDLTILSRSPELFFKKDKEDIYTKPMKGTSKRGKSPEEDKANFQFLSSDDKSRAENVMIVDLLRNDLSRISHRGTVKTKGLFEVETYETLHQMVSTVSAKIDDDISLTHLLKQIFPCGSITGAPKMRTMELIRNLEAEPRGIYTGSIGYINPDKSMCFNVAIRTLVLNKEGDGEMGVGSGVVHDSNAEAEYDECRLKGNFFTQGFSDFNIIESLLYEDGYKNLDKHIERLTKSTLKLGFPVDIDQIKKELLEFSNVVTVPSKVRVSVYRTGDYKFEHFPVEASKFEEKKIAISRIPVSLEQRELLAHKISLRTFYKKQYEQFCRDGYYDVIFMNENEEITEGSFHNIFVRIGEKWYTPPVSCGLLPGIQRQCLLESKQLDVTEKVLKVDDLKKADEIILTNAVRGIVKVELDLGLGLIEEGKKCFA